MSWIKIGTALHALADVLQLAHDAIPQDSQQKANVSVALQTVHDVATEVASVADANNGSLSNEQAKQSLISAFAPLIEELAAEAIQKVMATILHSHETTQTQNTAQDVGTGSGLVADTNPPAIGPNQLTGTADGNPNSVG